MDTLFTPYQFSPPSSETFDWSTAEGILTAYYECVEQPAAAFEEEADKFNSSVYSKALNDVAQATRQPDKIHELEESSSERVAQADLMTYQAGENGPELVAKWEQLLRGTSVTALDISPVVGRLTAADMRWNAARKRAEAVLHMWKSVLRTLDTDEGSESDLRTTALRAMQYARGLDEQAHSEWQKKAYANLANDLSEMGFEVSFDEFSYDRHWLVNTDDTAHNASLTLAEFLAFFPRGAR